MLNQKGIAFIPILIWTAVILFTGTAAVKEGLIKVDLSGNRPLIQKVDVTPTSSPSENPTPSFIPIPTSKPTATSTPPPTAKVNSAPVVAPTKQPLPVLSGSEIFNAINAYRASRSKPGLSVSDELCRIAEGRADFMMVDKMAAFKSSSKGNHTGFRDTFDYSGAGIGENLAANVVSTASVMALWKSSPPHNELMLATEWNGTPMIKGCIAIRVKDYGSVVVLEIGDK